jgi:hypothetical protein
MVASHSANNSYNEVDKHPIEKPFSDSQPRTMHFQVRNCWEADAHCQRVCSPVTNLNQKLLLT